MRKFEARNQHFDSLVNEPGLKWLGQNTNHFKPHPAVVEAMLATDKHFPKRPFTRHRGSSRMMTGRQSARRRD